MFKNVALRDYRDINDMATRVFQPELVFERCPSHDSVYVLRRCNNLEKKSYGCWRAVCPEQHCISKMAWFPNLKTEIASQKHIPKEWLPVFTFCGFPTDESVDRTKVPKIPTDE